MNQLEYGNWNANEINTKIYQKHWNTQFWELKNWPVSASVEFALKISKHFIFGTQYVQNFSFASHQVLLARTFPLYTNPSLEIYWKYVTSCFSVVYLSVYLVRNAFLRIENRKTEKCERLMKVVGLYFNIHLYLH